MAKQTIQFLSRKYLLEIQTVSPMYFVILWYSGKFVYNDKLPYICQKIKEING